MNELTYTMQGDYRLPNLLPPQEPEVTLGKYGLMRRRYLRQHRRVTYTNLLTSGKLTEHLLEIEQTAHSRMEQITAQMVRAEGVTEELKATDQMKWVGLMNGIRQAAEETVLTELIYN
ncbi:MAG: TnpV protein [Oscillospiraceae bacterium]|nr:TnpV protein [Oscillospiraceae bacterium]